MRTAIEARTPSPAARNSEQVLMESQASWAAIHGCTELDCPVHALFGMKGNFGTQIKNADELDQNLPLKDGGNEKCTNLADGKYAIQTHHIDFLCPYLREKYDVHNFPLYQSSIKSFMKSFDCNNNIEITSALAKELWKSPTIKEDDWSTTKPSSCDSYFDTSSSSDTCLLEKLEERLKGIKDVDISDLIDRYSFLFPAQPTEHSVEHSLSTGIASDTLTEASRIVFGLHGQTSPSASRDVSDLQNMLIQAVFGAQSVRNNGSTHGRGMSLSASIHDTLNTFPLANTGLCSSRPSSSHDRGPNTPIETTPASACLDWGYQTPGSVASPSIQQLLNRQLSPAHKEAIKGSPHTLSHYANDQLNYRHQTVSPLIKMDEESPFGYESPGDNNESPFHQCQDILNESSGENDAEKLSPPAPVVYQSTSTTGVVYDYRDCPVETYNRQGPVKLCPDYNYNCIQEEIPESSELPTRFRNLRDAVGYSSENASKLANTIDVQSSCLETCSYQSQEVCVIADKAGSLLGEVQRTTFVYDSLSPRTANGCSDRVDRYANRQVLCDFDRASESISSSTVSSERTSHYSEDAHHSDQGHRRSNVTRQTADILRKRSQGRHRRRSPGSDAFRRTHNVDVKYRWMFSSQPSTYRGRSRSPACRSPSETGRRRRSRSRRSWSRSRGYYTRRSCSTDRKYLSRNRDYGYTQGKHKNHRWNEDFRSDSRGSKDYKQRKYCKENYRL